MICGNRYANMGIRNVQLASCRQATGITTSISDRQAKTSKVGLIVAPPAWLVTTEEGVDVAAAAFLKHVMALAPFLHRLPALPAAAGGRLRQGAGRGHCLQKREKDSYNNIESQVHRTNNAWMRISTQ